MCLTTKNPTIKVAKKDILVYKECSGVTTESCTAETLHFLYNANKDSPAVRLKPYSGIRGGYEVHEGYHSYNRPRLSTNALFVIPKGASYISGNYNGNPFIRNRVSSTIKYIGPKKSSFIQVVLSRLGINL